jgi:hypothetical protein
LLLVSSGLIRARAIDHVDTIVQIAYQRAVDPSDTGFGARATQHRDQYPNPFGQIDPEWAQFGSTHFSGTVDTQGFAFGYHANADSTDPLDFIAVFGDLTSSKTILVLGDSNSQQWYPALDIAARNLGYRVVAANSLNAGGGMFELDNEFGDTWLSRGTEMSIQRANDRFLWIRDNLWAEADVVVVAVSPYYFSQDGTSPEYSVAAPERLVQTFRDITTATGHEPILLQAIPAMASPSGSLNQAIFINRQDQASAGREAQMNVVYDILNGIGAEDSFTYLRIDGLFLDDNGVAHTQIGGVPVYFNGDHINTLYSASAGEYFTEQLRGYISSHGL